MQLSAAGNTEIPALLVLENNGYKITVMDSFWRAVKYPNEFVANNPLELLGLVEIFNHRGNSWQATDSDIERCIKQYSGL